MSRCTGFLKLMTVLTVLSGLSVLLAACSASDNGAGLLPATYSLTGRVSGDIRQSVAVAVSGAVNATVSTDADGNYSVSGLPNGSYTVTPSRTGYTFTQPSRSVVVSGADASGNDFTAAAVHYAVTGTVSGAVEAGVTIAVTGTTEGGSPFTTSITTTGGGYAAPNVPNGSYTVTSSKTGYAFSPVSIAVTVSGGNASVAAFTSLVDSSVKFNLAGTVSGDRKAGVAITVTGSASGSASTLADGTYTVPNLPNGSYTVSASRPGYTFSSTIAAAIDGTDSTGNDFTATAVLYSISGAVSGDVKTGVAITIAGTTEGGSAFGPVETTTEGDGNYTAAGVPNGVYTVAAARSGYAFNPLSYGVTIAAGSSTGSDFTASMNPLAFIASGGTGTNGSGGDGGQFYAESSGSITVLRSGTVNALFTVPAVTPYFGDHAFIVSSGTTTVLLDNDPNDGQPHLYARSGDAYLYLGNGNGDATDDVAVTGLTVPFGATLVLVDQGWWSGFGSLQLENDLLVIGTLMTDLSANNGLYIEANLIDVETGGRITASAADPDSSGGEIYLGNGQGLTRTIINRGTIDAKGDGSGSGGYLYLEPDDLVANYGTIDVSGGSNGGSGGEFDAYVDYGDFYSSGTVRMNGGSGDTGGETEYSNESWYGYSCWIETAYQGNTNRNGDIIISGIWEAKGGDGANGNGGSGGYLYFQTDGLGTVTVNAYMSVKGGSGSGAGSSGGNAGEIDVVSTFNGGNDNPGPGRIRIAGTYDLRGGDGDQNGGSGGYLQVLGQGVNSANVGPDVECIAFPLMLMNGGEGAENGGNASGNAFSLYTYSYDGSTPAGPIMNEADVQAKGGNSTAGGTGGMGGYLEMRTGIPGDRSSVLSNSGNIDVSGGDGETGGSAFDGGDAINLQAQHVDTPGCLTANGGTGTITGGNGGNIILTSDDAGAPTTHTGALSAAGGSPGGGEGTITIDGSTGPF